ncbi:MAG: hypothetical protein ACKO2F_03840 [Cyanobacteriota bacterium]
MRRTTSHARSSKDEPKPKDKWDVIDILGRALVPVLVFIGGLVVNERLNQITSNQNSARTNLELEQKWAESTKGGILGGMFNKTLDNYYQSRSKDDLSGQLLNLELLVGNFHDSLDFVSMLNEAAQKILKQYSGNDRVILLTRVESLIRRAQASQLASIGRSGATKLLSLSKNDAEQKVVLQYCKSGWDWPMRIPLTIRLSATNDVVRVSMERHYRTGISGVARVLGDKYVLPLEATTLPMTNSLLLSEDIRVSFLPLSLSLSQENGIAKTNRLDLLIVAFPKDMASLKDLRSAPFSFDLLFKQGSQDKPNPSESCREQARIFAFVPPMDFDFRDLPMSK